MVTQHGDAGKKKKKTPNPIDRGESGEKVKKKNISRGKLQGNKIVINCKGEKRKRKERTNAKEK